MINKLPKLPPQLNNALELLSIDTSRFKEITVDELKNTLGLTIKKDDENKLITFLCELSAYTEDSQFNISFNAPASTGKSFIPTEIARLFPKEDVIEIGYCSPTAFFHDFGIYDKENKGYITVDLSRKILVFLDQPHNQLLERLRPFLSHDKKEINIKITDKSQKQGLRTKNVILRGYASVIFCTAGLHIDEQEATRFILLSPEVNQEKIKQGIQASIRKESNNKEYKSVLEENEDRVILKERLQAIKQEAIEEVLIPEELQKEIEKRFFEQNKILKPRHQRDIKRLICIIKALALLNLWWRNKNSRTIVAVKSDVNEAFALWEKISVSQELNLPPYIYKLYLEVILPIWNGKNGNRDGEIAEVTGKIGITRQEILQKHFDVYGRMLDGNQLRQQILPMLETCGLIIQESDPSNKRQKLIYPTALFTVSNNKQYSETSSGVLGNSVIQCGVNGLESYPTTELTISPTKQYSENENGVNNAVEIALNVFNGAKVVQYDH